MAYKSVTRIQVLSMGVVLVGLVIIVRMGQLQIVKAEDYKMRAERQYVQPKDGLFERGNIYFNSKDGEKFLVAGMESGFKVVANQNKIENADEAFSKIGSFLNLDKDTFIQKVTGNDPYIVLADKVSKETSDKILGAKVTGITLERYKWRTYPAKNISSQVIGFVGFVGDDITGRYGIEKGFDEILSRESKDVHINFFAEIFINIKKYVLENGEEEGNINLTIEPKVAQAFESILKRTQEKWNSEMVGGIVMNPKTGEILAMGNMPNFDPNNYSDVEDIGVFRNQSISGVFELGSVVKPLVMASAIDVGAVASDTYYDDLGKVEVGDKTIHNFDKRGRGRVNMQDVLVNSLNTGMVYAVQHMKKDDFKSYMESFELNLPTGIDLPNEEKGNLNNLNSKRDVEYATASFGQGISMTPIELVRGFSVFANDGKMVTPRVVKNVEYIDPLQKDIENEVVYSEQIIKPETAETITRMLTQVVDVGINTGKHKMEHYRIAAKTGTAQIPNPMGGYYEDRYLHSLIGYYPAYDPQFIVLMYNYYPKGASYASVSLADPFFEMAKYLLNYYNVTPDR